MPGTIHVNNEEVDTLVQNLKTTMQEDILNESKNRYESVTQGLGRVDGATRASLLEAVEHAQQKTAAVCETLEKLVGYIETASQELSRKDCDLANYLRSGD